MQLTLDTYKMTGTPILGGIRRKETLNALEKIKNTVINEERSGMRTLGAKNEFVRGNRGRSTLDTKGRRATILTNNDHMNGFQNGAFVNGSSEDEDEPNGRGHHHELRADVQEMRESIYHPESNRQQTLGRNQRSSQM